MTKSQLLIPETIKVGFQERNDTYTGKLAYVIYYDHTGKLRKEASWNSWRDKKIEPVEFKNEPTEGFVLNKNVGGYKSDWNYRSAHIRIYDPRDFEFEISVENLLFILAEYDCSRGKGLEGKFVYAWNGTELILLPTECESYKNSITYTSLQSGKVGVNDLVPGAFYKTKQQEVYTYIGKFKKHFKNPKDWKDKEAGTYQIFWHEQEFIYLKDLKTLAERQGTDVSPDYAELVEKLNLKDQKIVKLFVKQAKVDNYYAQYFHQEADGTFLVCRLNNYTRYSYGHSYVDDTEFFITNYRLSVKNGIFRKKRLNLNVFKNLQQKKRLKEEWSKTTYSYNRERLEYEDYESCVTPIKGELWAEFEDGSTSYIY